MMKCLFRMKTKATETDRVCYAFALLLECNSDSNSNLVANPLQRHRQLHR